MAHPYLAQYADPTDEPASLPYDQVHIVIITTIVVTAFGHLLKLDVTLPDLFFSAQTFEDHDLSVQEWKGGNQ